MSDVTQRISALSPERRQLLEQLRRKKRGAERTEKGTAQLTEPFSLVSDDDRAKLPHEVEDAYPLTSVQLGMLYHMELSPDDAAVPTYHNVNSFHLKAPLEVWAFEEAVQRVVARHPILRTAFDLTRFSEPLQLVYRTAFLPLDVEDLRQVDPQEGQRRLDEFLLAENRRLVDLSRPPLIRFRIHRRTDDTFQFTLTEPHAISDGWSTMSTLTEIFEDYSAILRGETPPERPPFSTTFRDFVFLERQILASPAARDFWNRKLDELEPERLPRWPGGPVADPPGADHKPTATFGRRLVTGLERLAREAEAPIKSVLLAAHCKAMAILAGRTDVVTGLTTHGRPEEADGEQVRGLFLNTLPFRLDLRGGTWVELVQRTFAGELDLMPFRRYPLAAIQGLRGGQVLFESAFSYLHFHAVQRVMRPGSLEIFGQGNSDLSTTHFPLAATFSRDPLQEAVISLTIEKNDEGMTLEQVHLLHGYYRRVIEAMAADPLARHEAASYLSDAELEQALYAWSGGSLCLEVGELLHERFAARAAERPLALAVVDPDAGTDAGLTYGQLDALSTRLAQRLRSLGVGPEVRVGIHLERSALIPVAILGVLKAGGCYVPMDPADPKERLEHLLADSGTRVLLTQQHLEAGLPLDRLGKDLAVVRLDPGWEQDWTGELPPSGALPANAAYVIYTSGSTGRPKGVVVTHACVIRLFDASERWFGFDDQDVWTLFHSFAFDFSVWEIWGALLHGGRLVVVPYLISRSPDAFRELLAREKVTVLNQTPSAFRQLIRADAEVETVAEQLALRTVIFGGEALELQSLAPWFERHGDRHPTLVNMYGITETTVHVTYRPVSGADLASSASVIGGPIPDLRLYVLDPEHFHPVPAGVPGELFVGGGGVARGYLGRPDLTAQRFVPDPFASAAGSRLYRSGDLARRLPGGDLEYIGRIDHQVKIRGFRIELGEIEAALVSHPGIAEAVVVAWREEGVSRLVAYAVPAPDRSPNVDEMRAHLQGRLPEHEVPAAFVFLAKLPLTVQGKVDRKALPAPEASRPDLGEGYVPPRSARESELAAIWAQTLGLDKVGIRDNYFALGGDSIRSIQLIARAREKGIELTIPQIFQHPTIEELARALGDGSLEAEMPPGADTLPFELLSGEDRRRLAAADAAGELEDAYPLARLQAGMLYHMDRMAADAAYHNVNSFHLAGPPFDPALFQEAIDRVIARHPILRTSFDFTSFSEPLQRVHREASLPVAVEDLRDLPVAEQEAVIDALVEREKRRHFDLERAPQLRMTVHRRHDDAFQLTLTENHAILDGWSLHSTLLEMFSLYVALLAGERPPVLPPPPIPYREFVALERATVEGEAARAYWEGRLADAQILDLPRWPAPEAWTGPRVESVAPPLAVETSEGLKRLAALAGVPLKAVCLAAHLKVLATLAATDDVLTGVVTHGRPEKAGSEETRGLFLNTLPLRFQLAPGTWRDLVLRTFAAEREMMPHRRFPLSELQKRHGARPLFEVLFNFTHFHVVTEILQAGELRVLGFKKSEETDLTLNVGFVQNPLTEHLGLDLAHDRTSIPRAEAQAIHGLYTRVLAAMAADGEARHDGATLLSPAERQQTVREWNDTGSAGLPELLWAPFSRTAAERPAAPALVAGERRLTYGELDALSNRLARRLRGLGVGPEVAVGLCLGRSPELVVAMLGVLKAGGAYVPLDPTYPQDRRDFVAADAAVALVVTAEELADLVPPGIERRLNIDVPEEWRNLSDSGLPDAGGASPGNLAYLIYTSGSTGRPKGVAIEHRNASALLTWALGLFAERETARVLASTSINFDLSIFEIFVPLARGGAVELVENALAMPAEPGITLVNTVPSVLSEVLRSGGLPPTVETVSLAGEPLRRGLVDRLYAAGSVARVYNLYGPSEDTTYSTWARIDPDDTGAPSIGRPILGTQAYVADRHLRLVPLGTAGELLLGGEGLARGYLGRPDLTAERFVPDPFGGQPGGRLYRTGDLSRALLDGRLEFLGRFDHQVKVRGFRIELGEIEAALVRHPAVREAVVTAPFGPEGERRLVAYFVPRDAQTPGGLLAAGLREHLEALLPPAMVPRILMQLAEMPRTPNGKIDRGALPVPSDARPELAQVYVAPRTPAEELMAGLFGAVLGVDRVGVFDGFFDLGGHSLSATQLVSRVRRSFGVELPLAELFRSSTPAALVQRVGALLAFGQGAEPAPPIVPVSRENPLPLSFGQERLWFLDQLEPGNAAYHIPTSLTLAGRLDTPALERSLATVVARHEALRTSFALVDGVPMQVIAPPGTIPGPLLPIIDLTALPTARRALLARRLANFELTRPFDLARGPVLRAALLRLAPEEHQILFAMHHIASDGWSMGVLVREVAALYTAEVEGGLPELPELPIQVADHAVWQRGWLQGETLDRQIEFWRGELAGLPAVLELPADRPRPPRQSFRGGVRQVRLPADLSAALEPFARRQGATLFMVLLAGFEALLARLSGQGDIAVGTPVAGRTQEETEPLIGLFLNTLVLRARIAADTTFEGLLAQARERSLAAFAHQELPFERLVDALGVERSLAFNPVFQVLLVLQNAPQGNLALPGLEVRAAGFDESAVQVDLQLALEVQGDRLAGSFKYASALFDATTVERLSAWLEALLAASLATPELRLAELPLLRPAEVHHLAHEWNDTAVAREPALLHRLIEAQARRTPAAEAVTFEGATLSYGELEARANRLAHRLLRLGLTPGGVVGVAAERSLDLVVALLAVLKAGGAYLPLESTYPDERLRGMMDDAGVPVLLVQAPLAERFAPLAPAGARLIELAGAAPARGRAAWDLPPAVDVSPASAAYVIFTSGSTGRPKGAVNTHQGIVNRLLWMQEAFALGADDRVLQKTPFGFDVSVWEFFWPLLVGARLVVARPGGHQDPSYLAGLIDAEGVTTVHFVPSMLQVFLEEPGLERCASLARVIASGEALAPDLERRFVERLGEPWGIELHNLYGPTEAAVDVTWQPCGRGAGRGSVPIGRPIANVRTCVLDPEGRLAPLGVAGELCLGGVQLARGYLGRPDLTAERFVPDGVSGEPGARLYRTGDRARLSPAGEIEYLGRLDFQVKIRGFRIELGEIEVALAGLPEVREAVVVARGEASQARLIAYVVPAEERGSAEPDEAWTAALRRGLERRLPAHMVPSIFVTLDALPLSPNGKVERRALPVPERAGSGAEAAYVAPRGRPKSSSPGSGPSC